MRFEHLPPARDGNLVRCSSMPFNSSKNGSSIGMNPAIFIASPLPLSNAFFVRDFEGVGEGNLIGFADRRRRVAGKVPRRQQGFGG